ncbi:Carbon storage regulator [Candidatus Magnetoovum chiemensis]|nr:Carbon storage regulator [Candidatus Magnetoovum chiemensis]
MQNRQGCKGGKMLVLTRKSDEAIKIGDNITITVIEVKGNKVRLGIEAPSTVRIYRKELYDKIEADNIIASNITIGEFDKIKNALGQ